MIARTFTRHFPNFYITSTDSPVSGVLTGSSRQAVPASVLPESLSSSSDSGSSLTNFMVSSTLCTLWLGSGDMSWGLGVSLNSRFTSNAANTGSTSLSTVTERYKDQDQHSACCGLGLATCPEGWACLLLRLHRREHKLYSTSLSTETERSKCQDQHSACCSWGLATCPEGWACLLLHLHRQQLSKNCKRSQTSVVMAQR